MKTSIRLAAVALATAAAFPAAAEVYQFNRDGVVYSVEETVREDGVRVIKGSDSTGATFLYRVRGTQVSGTYRGEPVYFTAPAARPRVLASR